MIVRHPVPSQEYFSPAAVINQTRNRNESERIASRREGRKKYHGKNQVRPPVGRKTVGWAMGGWWAGVGGGGRCGGRALGGRRVRDPAPGRARGAGHTHDGPAELARRRPHSPPRRRLSRADAGPRRANTHSVPDPTVHVQSAKVSATDRNRESDPAADSRGTDLHDAQG